MYIGFDMLRSSNDRAGGMPERARGLVRKGVERMRKKLCFLFPVMAAVLMCGCGGTSTPAVSLSDYNAVVEERNIAQAKVAELKQSTVSKGDYDRIVSERAELKSKVAELEAAAAKAEAAAVEEKKAEEDKQEVITNEPGVYGDIHYFIAPVSISDRLGHNWTIEEFEVTGLKKFGDKNYIYYTCAGTGDRWPITFFCYDKDGYQVDSFHFNVTTNSSTDKFKVQEWGYISPETVRIDVE